MTSTRTKQQTACDGVRVVWRGGDTFTNILQQQVEMQFSIDGVIPFKNTGYAEKVRRGNLETTFYKKQKQQFVRSLDGIRLPWKEVLPA